MPDTPQLKTESRAAVDAVVLDRPGSVTVVDAGPRTRFSYRGPAGPVTVAFGVEGVAAACRAAHANRRASLWLGPDERLLLAPEGEGPAIVAAFAGSAGTEPHSLVDVSHRSIGLLISGPAGERLLSSACPLDFDASAFPVDMCTRTIFGKAEIVVWRFAPDAFHIEVWRSFAPYVSALMREAARDI